MKKRRDSQVARQVCDRHLWLSTIVLSPHHQQHQRLTTAAACHLLFASGFRVPKHACTQTGHQVSPKRRRLHHTQLPNTYAEPPLQQLQRAAAVADIGKLEQLCSCKGEGVDVNAPWGTNGRTALHAAAEAGSAESVEVLLRLGADSYAADNGGASPLILAAAGGHAASVKVLLAAGADPFHVDHGGVNPLLCAARLGSAPCMQLLLDEGVDPDYANTDLGAGEHALLLAAESGSVPAVRLLLAAGARLNRTDSAGRTALWAAARHGHALVVQLLLSQPGIKHIRSYCCRSTTPLQEAHAAHHTTCVALLSAHLQEPGQQQQLAVQQHAAPDGSRRVQELHPQQQHAASEHSRKSQQLVPKHTHNQQQPPPCRQRQPHTTVVPGAMPRLRVVKA